MKKAMIVMLLLSTFAVAKDKNLKNLSWQTGTLIDQADERVCPVYEGNSRCTLITRYAVDAGDVLIIFGRAIWASGDKRLDVMMNAPIKFAQIGNKYFLQDEQGQPHEVTVVQKTLKSPAKQ
jgi:hypothetical protein